MALYRKCAVNICWIIILVSCLLVSCEKKYPKFESLNQFNSVDTIQQNGRSFITKQLNFIVKDYSNSEEAKKAIDAFAMEQVKNSEKGITYLLVFYKYSEITNVNHLKAYPRDIDRYSQDNDMIFTYRWLDGKLESKTVIDNGTIISPR